jgi:predicted cupin superfamily sugar epimerase
MTNDLSAEEVRAVLKLESHATCGFVRVTFISNQRIAPGGLRAAFLDGRPAGSALYFMVTPDAPVRLHSATISFTTVTWAIQLKFLCCTRMEQASTSS